MATVCKPLTLMYWNANGVRRDYNILTEFLEEQCVDILLINETHLTANKRLTIRNYCIYRNDGPRAPHGGTAIAIKSTLHHRHVPTPNFTNLEATFIEIPTNNTHLQFGAIYCSPSLPLLQSDLDLLHSMANNYIHTGDFNAKNTIWNSLITTARGKLLEEHANLNNYNIIAPNEPTHYPYNNQHRPDVLDIALMNTTFIPLNIETIPALTSDHNPVILTINIVPASTTLLGNITADIDWGILRSYLTLSIPGNLNAETEDDLEDAVKMYISTVKQALRMSTHYYKKSQNTKTNEEIKKMCQQKRCARKKWQRTRNEADKNIYNNLKNKLHRKASEIRINQFEADVRDASSSNNIWKITKRLTKPQIFSSQQPIHTATGLKYNPLEKAEAIADYLEELYMEPSENGTNLDFNTDIRHGINTIHLPTQTAVPYVTPSEVKKEIKSLKSSKSPGPDKISNLVLKNMPYKMICHITKIFNCALKLEYFPKCWRHAHIVTIPKNKKNPCLPENRRPISLLDTHGKLLEKIILRRMLPYTSITIPPWQTAFQKGRSVNHNLLALVEDVTKAFNTQSYTSAIFLDVQKAFDKVWHKGLLHKLKSCLPKALTCIIASFLESRTFQVKMDGALSSVHVSSAGVPQGSILGPILYCLYTSDVPTTTKTKILMYADDIVVYGISQNPNFAVSKTQEHINLLENWFNKWRISINQEKCQAIIFTRCKKRPRENLLIKNHEIQFTDCIKYLGILLDQKLLWRRHISQTKTKASARISLIFPLLKSPVLSLKRKVTLYKALILPILTYASPAWCYIPKSVFQPLQTMQNKALRIIHASDWYTRTTQLHEDLQMKTLKEMLKEQVKKFYKKMENSENTFIQSLGQYNCKAYSKHRTPKLFVME